MLNGGYQEVLPLSPSVGLCAGIIKNVACVLLLKIVKWEIHKPPRFKMTQPSTNTLTKLPIVT